jgi:diguanylate cyclase (GGDEF)-like protein
MPSASTPDEALATILALSVAALAQSAFYVHRIARYRYARASDESARQRSAEELDAVRREHSLCSFENQLLREFLSQTSPSAAVELLLRRFIPNPATGFAAFIERTPCGTTCAFSRGLSDESLASLALSESELAVVQEARILPLAGAAGRDSSVIAGLSRHDASKATRLHLFALGQGADPIGVFVATDLCPETGDPAARVALARRLIIGLSAMLQADRALKERDARLRLTSEMLDLRSLADQSFQHPVALIESFLSALAPKVGAEGAALFLFSKEGGTAGPAVARSGGPRAAALTGCWRDYEERLARFAVTMDRPRLLGPSDLSHYGIEAVMRSVLLLPLRRSDSAPVGVICLSRGEPRPFTTEDQTLAAWAAEFLAQAIPRVLSQVMIERQARRDGLTGLANRREWDQRFPALVEEARRNGSEASLLLCDLDRFKSVNDTYGHRAGDEALRVAARTIQDQVLRTRSSDWALIARYGGEELAVLLPGFGTAGAQRVAEAIRTAVERTIVSFDGRALRTTVSIGTATFPCQAETAERLFARADDALYEAKSRGRNRVCSAGGGVTPPAEGAGPLAAAPAAAKER